MLLSENMTLTKEVLDSTVSYALTEHQEKVRYLEASIQSGTQHGASIHQESVSSRCGPQ